MKKPLIVVPIRASNEDWLSAARSHKRTAKSVVALFKSSL